MREFIVTGKRFGRKYVRLCCKMKKQADIYNKNQFKGGHRDGM